MEWCICGESMWSIVYVVMACGVVYVVRVCSVWTGVYVVKV